MTDPETLSPLRTLPWRRLILAILLVALATQPIFLVAASSLQLEEDIGLSTTGLGALTAAFFLAAAFTSAPIGRWVDRIGWQRAMRINVVGSAVVLIAIATLARSFPALLVLLIVGGGLYGFANPAANKALAERVDPSRRSLIFGLKHAGIPASTLLAGLALPVIIVRWSWPAAFAAALLLVPVVWYLISSDRENGDTNPAVDAPGRGARPLTVVDLATLALAAALGTTAAMALSVFLVEASVEVASLTESAAGVLLFAGSLASIAGRMGAGLVTDRVHGRGFTALAVLLGGGALVFALLPATTGAQFVLLVLLGFATGWGWPGMMTFTVVNANTASVAASSSITQAGVFLGAGVGPVLLGWTIDANSFQTSWLVVAAALFLAAVIVTVIGLHTQRPEPAAVTEASR